MMRSKNFWAFLALVCIFFFSLQARGQTPLLFGNENAFYLKVGYAESKRINLKGGELGYALSGIAGFSLGASQLGYENFNIYGISLAPALSFKPNFKSPIQVAVSAGYTANIYRTDQLKLVGLQKLREATYGLSASLFSRVKLSRKTQFLPMLNVQYLASSASRKDLFGQSAQANYNAIGLDIFTGLRFDILPGSFLVIAPGFTLFEDENVYTVNLTLGFKKAHCEKTTKLPNFRKRFSKYNKNCDDEILTAFRKKYPDLNKLSDKELIKLIETKSGPKKSKE